MAEVAQPPTRRKLPPEQTAVRTISEGPGIQVDPFRIFAYIVMTIGAIACVLPFLWMFSVSLMTLGETQSGQFVTNQALLQTFTYSEVEMEQVMGSDPAAWPSFLRTATEVGASEEALTWREYAEARDVYWVVGNTVIRGGVVNYLTAWNRAQFGLFFRNSVIMTGLQVLGQTLFSILAAYAFARMEFPGRDLLFSMFLATLFIPSTIILIPNFLTVTGLNEVFNAFWEQVGLLDFASAVGLRWIDGWFGLVVPFLASTFGIFLLRQFFRQIPGELYDAAQIDGAGHLRFLFQVAVPISRAAIVTIALFTFLGAWNALDWPILVTYAAEWRPISYGLYAFQQDVNVELNFMMAGAVIALVPVLIVYFFTQKQFTEGIATTGLKG